MMDMQSVDENELLEDVVSKQKPYVGVHTRFLREDERLVLSEEKEMPLVIEAYEARDLEFLKTFLHKHAEQLRNDIAKYGAVLFRGFDVQTEADFEHAVLSISGLNGIGEAFMSEEGRIHVDDLKYVLHTNAVYKTGGTLYLGGFHSENYYSTDVPEYICFFCQKPSVLGGETGLINTTKIYEHLDPALIAKLEARSFFVTKWLVSEVAERYQVSDQFIEQLCQQAKLPIVGIGEDRFILMYKPSVFEHPLTQKKALQLNFFELLSLNVALRKCFMRDYQGKTWFWHRFVWRLPAMVLSIIERIYIACASFFYSPKQSLGVLRTKYRVYRSSKKIKNSADQTKVGSCFDDKETQILAKLMRTYYSSCLWQKGDLLLVDNRQVVHAGMPGKGDRLVRAMICNPLSMRYDSTQSGVLACHPRTTQPIGQLMCEGILPTMET